MQSKLWARTAQLLKETPIPLTRIARVVGAHPRTLATVRDGTNAPSVELCEAVYNYLSRDPLEVK